MAKRKIILPVALVAVILVAAVAFAACAPSSYSVMSPALQDYYGDYGEYYNNIVKSGRVRYRDVESDLYGYLDASGNVAIPAKYSSATSFGDGFAVVRLGSTYSVIDEDGGVIAGGFTSRTWTPAGNRGQGRHVRRLQQGRLRAPRGIQLHNGELFQLYN